MAKEINAIKNEIQTKKARIAEPMFIGGSLGEIQEQLNMIWEKLDELSDKINALEK